MKIRMIIFSHVDPPPNKTPPLLIEFNADILNYRKKSNYVDGVYHIISSFVNKNNFKSFRVQLI